MEGRNQEHKGKEQMMYLLLVGLNMTGAVIATVYLMDGPLVLTRLLGVPIAPDDSKFWTSLPISPAALEFLILGAAPALLCHLLSCFLLIAYYRYAHTWRRIGGERDLDSCCCCGCCCCTCIGRLCSQENPVVGEIPIWEQVGFNCMLLSICFPQPKKRPLRTMSLPSTFATSLSPHQVSTEREKFNSFVQGRDVG